MKQTPVHLNSNPDLLAALPMRAKRLVEVGCSSGALARDYKARNENCWYLGCDIDASYVDMAAEYCDEVLVLDIDLADEQFYQKYYGCDAWIFGDTLEHMKDPWRVLSKVGRVLSDGGVVVACIPNAQHWSMQVRLAMGNFNYEDAGLFDRTHLRWFTRKTILQMFDEAGFDVDLIVPRIFHEPEFEMAAPIISELAELYGSDPGEAAADARPLQYVVRGAVRR